MKELELKLRGLSLRQPSPGYCERVLAQRPRGLEATTSRGGEEPAAGTGPVRMGDRIMRSRITQLATAAVIVTAAVIGLTYWLPTGGPTLTEEVEIEIPAELAQMPVEKLLEMHFGKAESSFAPDVLAAAVAKAMGRLSVREILAIGRKYGEGRGEAISACMIATLPPALSRIVEACDFVVGVRVEQVDLDVSDIKAAIIHKQRNQLSIYSGAPIKTTVQLRVLEVYPPLPSNVGEKIRFTPVFNSEDINLLEEGKEYLIALSHRNGLFWLQRWNRGVYPVDPNSTEVANLRNGRMPLDEVWEFIMDSYDAIHEGTLPSAEVFDYWVAKLQSDDMTNCLTAIEYFNTLPEPAAPAELVVDAMERFLGGRIVDSDKDVVNAGLRRDCLAVETLELLSEVADEPTVERMVALYEQDVSSGQGIFHEEMSRYDGTGSVPESIVKMLKFVLERPGPERRERFLSLLSQLLGRAGEETWRRQECVRWVLEAVGDDLGKVEGADIDALVLDMLENPASFDISTFYSLSFVWKAAQARGLPEFGAYLEQFLADPPMQISDAWHGEHAIGAYARKTMGRKEAIQYVAGLYEQGKISTNAVMDVMNELLEPQDIEFVWLLSEAVKRDWWMAPILAAEVLPDPCLVPALRQALEREEPGRGMLLQALFACGEEEQAIEMALAFVQRHFDEQGAETAGKPYDDYDLRATIKFLGASGDVSAIPAIEYFVPDDMDEPLSGSINEPRNIPIQALARLGGESAVARLKNLYDSQDILVRLLAALSLYYLGDDTGYELLEHFVNGTERSIPEVEMHWGRSWSLAEVFHRPLLYLRSADTDALLLESLGHHGFPHEDIGGTGNDSRYYAYAFAKEYKHQILPILVEQLFSNDGKVRESADGLLRRLTGQNFGFQPDKFVFQQTEPIERWRSYVEDYLAEQQMNSAELTSE
jgi:HEAT repeat protein